MREPSLPPIRLPFVSRPHLARLLLLLLFLTTCLWFSSRALLTANFLPHWYCLAGNTRLLWTTVLGDLFIGVSYAAISATPVGIIRTAGSDLPYQGFFWAFGLFIISCGITRFIVLGVMSLRSFLGVPIYKGDEIAGLIAVANREEGHSGGKWNSLETMSRAAGILYDNYRQTLARAAFDEKQTFLEAPVRQSQNLDLLARVAGGFAHDFNNLLMILSGASELLDRSLGPESLSRVYVDQIQRSTTKAAAITRQLLAFSRKQVLHVRPMDLHAALSEAQSLLSHLMGSAIEVKFSTQASSS
jgi:signal transduction histidine kinase